MAPGRLLGLVCAFAFVCSCLSPVAAGEDDDGYAMFVSVDETKVSIISGNLTVAVTRDWPRLVFWHSVDPFSPTFEVGFPKMYLFNDTDGDGRFCRAEAVYTIFLDSNHVEWNLSSVQSDFDDDMGEFVMFSMRARADAYSSAIEESLAVESWANVTFWFCIAEGATTYENPAGAHSLSGKTDAFVNMTVEVTNRTEFQSLAVERFLQGGGSTDEFHILEDGPEGGVSAVLSGRVDESVGDEDFMRPLNGTDSPTQCVEFAKDDGAVQAFYRWGSEAADRSGLVPGIHMNSTCFTTGVGLMLHSSLPLENGTVSFSHDSSIGIQEEGFVGAMTDWVKENVLAVAVVAAATAAVAVVVLHIALRRRRLQGRSREDGVRKDGG